MGASAAVKGRRPGCGVGTEQEGGSQDAELARRGCRAQSGRPGRGGPLISAIPPQGVSRCASPVERRPLCSSDMICNFRQTFEVPDICIMWASLLATGNSCLAFPRLNCNYTRSLPGGGGGGRGVNTASWHFQTHLAFIHFLPPVKRPGIRTGPGCYCPCLRGCCC